MLAYLAGRLNEHKGALAEISLHLLVWGTAFLVLLCLSPTLDLNSC